MVHRCISPCKLTVALDMINEKRQNGFYSVERQKRNEELDLKVIGAYKEQGMIKHRILKGKEVFMTSHKLKSNIGRVASMYMLSGINDLHGLYGCINDLMRNLRFSR